MVLVLESQRQRAALCAAGGSRCPPSRSRYRELRGASGLATAGGDAVPVHGPASTAGVRERVPWSSAVRGVPVPRPGPTSSAGVLWTASTARLPDPLDVLGRLPT
jgi:hypothetical protein